MPPGQTCLHTKSPSTFHLLLNSLSLTDRSYLSRYSATRHRWLKRLSTRLQLPAIHDLTPLELAAFNPSRSFAASITTCLNPFHTCPFPRLKEPMPIRRRRPARQRLIYLPIRPQQTILKAQSQ